MRRRLPALPVLPALLVLSGLLAGCGGGEVSRKVPPDRVTISTAEAGRAASLISEYRKSRGLGPVVADARLSEPAIAQARAVAEAGTLSHGAFATRMVEFRVPGISAENLSAGSSDVAGAIARWKASAGHDANLLMKEARRIGLARADSPGYGYEHYWVLVLAQ